MNFPELTTSEVFAKIPKGSPEAQAEFIWSASLLYQGNTEITQKPLIGNGHPDVLVRFYDSMGDRYTWMYIEFKRYEKQFNESIAQLLMYLGNNFYDTSLEGIDNFSGVISASAEHFCLIPRKNILGIMEKFEYIWRKHFRVPPHDAYKVEEIKQFVLDNLRELTDGCLYIRRSRTNIRLNEIIKSIYEAWNLQ